MSTTTIVSAGSAQTFTAPSDGAVFTVVADGGGDIGFATDENGRDIAFQPSGMRRAFGPLRSGQSIRVTVQAGTISVIATDASPSTSGAVFVPRSNKIGLIGDSITNQNTIPHSSGGLSRVSGTGYASQALTQADQCAEIVWNLGVNGKRASQIAVDLPGQLGALQEVDSVFVLAGTNDIDISDTFANITANLASIFATISARGYYCYSLTVMPRPTVSAGQKQTLVRVNKWLLDYWRGRADGECIDVFAALVVPTSTTQAAVTGALFDSLHPGFLGAYLMGKVIAPRLTERYRQWASPGVTNAMDEPTYNASGRQMLANPLMLATGSVTNGTRPTGYSVGTNFPTYTESVAARSDGLGNYYEIYVPAGSGPVVQSDFNIYAPPAMPGLQVGDSFWYECDFEVIDAVSINGFIGLMYTAGPWLPDTDVPFALSGGKPPDQFIPAGASKYRLRSPVVKVPSGVTAVQPQVSITAGVGGSGRFRLSRMALWKV